ncbi:MAG: hypothetical protein WC538_10985 [Thermoanaerobaculia bacterium]
MTTQKGSIRGITRMDYERATGWLVRVYRGGTTHSKFFADSLHGGKRRAKQAAVEYRDMYEELHPSPPRSIPPSAISTRPVLASTRVRGVSETFQRTPAGKKIPCFSVSYRLGGVRKSKRFYHHLFSSRRAALRAATEFRQEVERQMEREHRKRLREWKKEHAQFLPFPRS